MNGDRKQAAARLSKIVAGDQVRCAVVGLGFIGSTLMDAFRVKGVEVHGYDRNREAVRRFRDRDDGRFENSGAAWSAGDDPSVVAGADVVVAAVRALMRDASTDLEPLRAVADLLKSAADRDRLIVLESTVPPGTTRRFAEWCRTGAHETFVAHSPERLSVGHDWRTLETCPHLVGGIDPHSTQIAHRLLSRICNEVTGVSGPEVSELSKLLENAFLTVSIALIGEITKLAHAAGISAQEVTEAAATKPTGYLAFHPGPGVGGHCLPNDLRMLQQSARDLGWEPDLLSATRTVVDALPGMVVDRLEAILAEKELSLNGADILVVGVGFKIGCADTTCSPSTEVVRLLLDRGALPEYLDSGVPPFDIDGRKIHRVTHEELRGRKYTAVVLLAGDAMLTAEDLVGVSETILDAGGGRLLPDPLSRAHLL